MHSVPLVIHEQVDHIMCLPLIMSLLYKWCAWKSLMVFIDYFLSLNAEWSCLKDNVPEFEKARHTFRTQWKVQHVFTLLQSFFMFQSLLIPPSFLPRLTCFFSFSVPMKGSQHEILTVSLSKDVTRPVEIARIFYICLWLPATASFFFFNFHPNVLL